MKSLNLLNALQITLAIAIALLLIIGFYAVAFHALHVDDYKIMLFICATISIAQMLIEALREHKLINI